MVELWQPVDKILNINMLKFKMTKVSILSSLYLCYTQNQLMKNPFSSSLHRICLSILCVIICSCNQSETVDNETDFCSKIHRNEDVSLSKELEINFDTRGCQSFIFEISAALCESSSLLHLNSVLSNKTSFL